MLSQELLNSLFEYIDGILFRKRNGEIIKIGKRTSGYNYKSYKYVSINRKVFHEHRVIWIMFNGDIPTGMQIDHIDLCRSNNRIENLRLATKVQNRYNTPVQKNSISGIKGVKYNKKNRNWNASIRVDKKTIHLGTFKCPFKAGEVAKIAMERVHGEFAYAQNK